MVAISVSLARCWVVEARRGSGGKNLGVGWEEAARSIEYLQFSNFSADPFQFSQYRCSHAPAHDRGGKDLFLCIF